jgi:hypothetical protein
MQPNIYNFFKFLEDKEGRPIPFKIKLIHAPKTLTPDELNVKGNLNLMNTKIKSLPDGLQVRGYLYLRDTPITSLPEGLKVERWLDLRNTPITSLPKGLQVRGDLYIENTPLAKKSNEEIKAMIEPTGFIKGIYKR